MLGRCSTPEYYSASEGSRSSGNVETTADPNPEDLEEQLYDFYSRTTFVDFDHPLIEKTRDPNFVEMNREYDSTVFKKGSFICTFEGVVVDAIFNDLMVTDLDGNPLRLYTLNYDIEFDKGQKIEVVWRDAIEYNGLGHEDNPEENFERVVIAEKVTAINN
jgi:hypothetical protein